MERDTLSDLNGYQSTVLAVVASVLTALAVLYILRLRDGATATESGDGVREPAQQSHADASEQLPHPAAESPAAVESMTGSPIESAEQPAVETAHPSAVRPHFSEDLIVPGLTHTGEEIAETDVQDGRSPDGV